jgi:hypothetical protein
MAMALASANACTAPTESDDASESALVGADLSVHADTIAASIPKTTSRPTENHHQRPSPKDCHMRTWSAVRGTIVFITIASGATGCTAEPASEDDILDSTSEELAVIPHGFLKNDEGRCLETDVPFAGTDVFTAVGNCEAPDDGGNKLVSIVSTSFVATGTNSFGDPYSTTVAGVQIRFRDLYNRTKSPAPKMTTRCLLTNGKLGVCTPSTNNIFRRVGRTIRPIYASSGVAVPLPVALGEGALVSNWYRFNWLRTLTAPSAQWTFIPK